MHRVESLEAWLEGGRFPLLALPHALFGLPVTLPDRIAPGSDCIDWEFGLFVAHFLITSEVDSTKWMVWVH